MIPPVREFLSACAFLARRFDWDLSPHSEDLIEALTDARLEAERLALATGDEVASLFYACIVPSAWLGEDYAKLIVVVTLNHAMSLGRRPLHDPLRLMRELSMEWAHAIIADVVSFEALRAWLEANLPKQAS